MRPMALVSSPPARLGVRSVTGSLEIGTSAEAAFLLLATPEKWPVWLAFVRSAERVRPGEPLEIGSEVVLRSAIPGEPEQIYEVDRFIRDFHLSLVGAYSVRRRIDVRVERKITRADATGSSRSKIHLRIDYPAYGGHLGLLYDRLRHGRRLANALEESLAAFRGLAEFENHGEPALADF